ncbi:hypothetical protein IKE71_02565 [Candidatus Saccharibacteria bacterium]|nr:hypothetical protein [Candidatus Saccharibacteria bacterium]
MKTAQKRRNFHTRSNKASNRGRSSEITTKMNVKIKRRNDPAVARRFIAISVIASSILVAVAIFVAIYFDANKVAQRKLEELATTYYEDYYYEKLMSEIAPELKEERLQLYAQTGLQPVLLRQLLLYQNGKFSSYKKYFEKDGFSCDKNKTSVKFYPYAPYGVKDYMVKYELSCSSE